MAEPSTVGVGVGAGLAGGVIVGLNPIAAAGAICGAIVYFIWAQEIPLAKRIALFLVSFVMGCICAPLASKIQIFGFNIEGLPGLASFIVSLLIVTVSMAALNGRSKPNGGGQ